MDRCQSTTSATGGNLDSLLDTLTDLVGLRDPGGPRVAAQRSSREAASRIANQLEQSDPAEVAWIEQAAEERPTQLRRNLDHAPVTPSPPNLVD